MRRLVLNVLAFLAGCASSVFVGVAWGAASDLNTPTGCDPDYPGEWRLGTTTTYYAAPSGVANYARTTGTYNCTSYTCTDATEYSCDTYSGGACVTVRYKYHTCPNSDPTCASPTLRQGTTTRKTATSYSCTVPPVECSTAALGTKFYKSGATFAALPKTICDTSSLCVATRDAVAVCMGGECLGSYKVGSTTCAGTGDYASANAQGESGASGAQDAEKCAGEYCVSKEGGQCGYVNSEWVCLTSTPADGCQETGAGGRVCDSDAAVPPVPSTAGDRAVAATPDGTVSADIKNAAGTTTGEPIYNYYDNTTVTGAANAGAGAPTTGTVGGTDTNGDGYGGDPPADETPPCSGPSCLSGPTMTDNPTFGDRTTLFYERASASPLVAAVSGLGDSLGAGVCPTATFTAFGTEFELSPGCDILDGLLATLQLVSLAGWALVAVRIVMGA